MKATLVARTRGTARRRRRLAVALLGATVLVACSARPPSAGPPRPAAAPFAIEEATVAQLQARMASGQDTAVSLVDRYLVRIEQLDREGPALRSVLETNPDARAVAEQLDAERASGRLRGPLHGVPVLLKDNVATADRLQTTAGSLAWAGAPAAEDAFLVSRLRAAGAVVLGKSNLSEWANFRSLRSSSGWSARGGQTRNCYAPERSPSGSSSGSAVAVAANLTAVAVGTETDGSIVSPASVNGIVGIKPTLGLVSRRGLVPIAHSQDTAGPMARTVADAAILLGVLAGSDPDDPATAAADTLGHRDYTTFLDADGLRGARIGVVRGLFGASPGSDAAATAALAVLRARGAVLVDPADIPALNTIPTSELDLLLGEFGPDLDAYVRRYHPGIQAGSLAAIIRFNDDHAAEELAFFGQELLIEAQARRFQPRQRVEALRTENRRRARRDGIDLVMDRYRLNALVAPTEGPAWTIDHEHGDPRTPRPATSTAPAIAGYPHVTVPMGFEQGLPLGLSFIGRAWSEPLLVRLAYAFEQATRARRAPPLPAVATGVR